MTSAHTSIIPQFIQILEIMGVEDDFIINKTDITNKTTGNKIYFKGIKTGSGVQTAALKSLTGITTFVVEEAEEIDDYEAFEKIDLSIRSKEYQNRVILILNPCSKGHMIYGEWFEDDNAERDDTNYIHTTYLDNKENISESVIKKFERLKKKNPTKYKNIVMGAWGKINTGGEYYPHWDYDQFVEERIAYDPTKPLFVSLDENVVPYNTMTIYQVDQNSMFSTIKVIDEICEFDWNLSMVCQEFNKRYRRHNSGVFVYGDATSQKRDVKIDPEYNYFTLVMKYLQQFKPILRVPKTNPSVILRRQFVDAIMTGEVENIRIKVDKKCKKFISDFDNLKFGKDGKKDKTVVKDTTRGISYQPYGHTSDTFEYFLVQNFMSDYIKFEHGYSDFKGVLIPKKTNSY